MTNMEQAVFNWVVAAGGFCIGWVLKVIWDAIIELKQDVREMNKELHEDFVRREDFRESVAEIKADMRENFKEVKDLIGVVFKKVDCINRQ